MPYRELVKLEWVLIVLLIIIVGGLMSLIDADKGSTSRGEPTLNTDDNVQNRMAHKTLGTTYKTTGNEDTNRLIFDKAAIKGVDQFENTSLYLGYDPTISARPILRIAKEEKDALTGADSDLIFNSEQNVFKIVRTGQFRTSLTYTTPSPGAGNFGTQTFIAATIPHGLGYIPAVIGFLNPSSQIYQPLPFTDYLTTGSSAYWQTWNISTDATNVTISLVTMVYGGSYFVSPGVNFNYYLLQETAN